MDVPQQYKSQLSPMSLEEDSTGICQGVSDPCEDSSSPHSSGISEFTSFQSGYSYLPNQNEVCLYGLDSGQLNMGSGLPQNIIYETATSSDHIQDSVNRINVDASHPFTFLATPSEAGPWNRHQRLYQYLCNEHQQESHFIVKEYDVQSGRSLGPHECYNLQEMVPNGAEHLRELYGAHIAPSPEMYQRSMPSSTHHTAPSNNDLLAMDSVQLHYNSRSAFQPWRSASAGKKTTTSKAVGQSLLKRCLIQVLPKIKRDLDTQQVHEDFGIFGEQASRSQLIQCSKIEKCSNIQRTMAERERRRRQGACMKQLRNMIPGITKGEKVKVMESAINYINELHARVNELQARVNDLERQKMPNP
eukprot:c26399_g1_i1 orf=282-1361(+)